MNTLQLTYIAIMLLVAVSALLVTITDYRRDVRIWAAMAMLGWAAALMNYL